MLGSKSNTNIEIGCHSSIILHYFFFQQFGLLGKSDQKNRCDHVNSQSQNGDEKIRNKNKIKFRFKSLGESLRPTSSDTVAWAHFFYGRQGVPLNI